MWWVFQLGLLNMQRLKDFSLCKVNGQQLCACFQIPSFLSAWLHKNSLLSSVCCSIYILWTYRIILSYSYLTLPEKQSSSAVTWASPGCHVFLKGCLRGTSLDSLHSFRVSIHLWISSFVFLLKFKYIHHSNIAI